MKSLISIIKEQFTNFYLIQRLAMYEIKSTNNNNYLGYMWELINPAIQITVYWFVFGLGIRGGDPVGAEEIPFIMWLLAGMTVWLFVQPSLLQGSKSIYTRIRMISKMSFPTSVIPSFVLASKFYVHLVLVVIAIVIFQFAGFTLDIYYLQLPVYILLAVLLLLAINLITSTLSTIIRDVQMIVQAVLRMGIYLSPILWVPDRLPEFAQTIIRLNPITYLIEGYRAAFFYQEWFFISHWEYTLYFLAVLLVLLLIGSSLHMKFRNQLIDFL